MVTCDGEVMVVEMVARVEIDFIKILLAEIHERAFNTTIIYSSPWMIFQLCKDVRVPIWHCDKLVLAMGTLYIRLIQNEVNVEAPRRGAWVDVPMGNDLVNAIKQMNREGTTATNDTLVSSSHLASQALISSRATPSPEPRWYHWPESKSLRIRWTHCSTISNVGWRIWEAQRKEVGDLHVS